MKEFPRFMRSGGNAIDPAMVSEGVEGYIFDGADGSQMAVFTTHKDGKSREHTHPYDEYFLVIEGECTLCIGGERVVLRKGDEYHIPQGEPHSTEFKGGSRSIHAFAGQRAKRTGQK
jgi:quercetin dioxygenase-like cupin family protein